MEEELVIRCICVATMFIKTFGKQLSGKNYRIVLYIVNLKGQHFKVKVCKDMLGKITVSNLPAAFIKEVLVRAHKTNDLETC